MPIRFGSALLISAAMSVSPVVLAAQSAGLVVRAASKEVVLSAADLAALPRQQLKTAAEGSADSVVVSGVTLWDVINKAGAVSREASGRQRAATYVRVIAADGATAIFALVELDPGFSKKTVVAIDQRNGRPLDVSEGPWRLVVPDEIRHARWVRGLRVIEVGTLPAVEAGKR